MAGLSITTETTDDETSLLRQGVHVWPAGADRSLLDLRLRFTLRK